MSTLIEAGKFASAHQVPSRDLRALHRGNIEHEPHNDDLGEVKALRCESNGVIWHDGEIRHAWGPTDAPDTCMSVTKSFLSVLTGVAERTGVIASIDSQVAHYVENVSPTVSALEGVTFRHLLQQTSNWQGSLWGKPHWIVDLLPGIGAERHDDAGAVPPGRIWQYNDVRVNLLAFILTAAFGEELPAVLQREVLDPIGVGTDWEWGAYRNARLTIPGGEELRSVSGGGHWGGGLVMSSLDLLRFGRLCLGHGTWHGAEVVTRDYFNAAVTPCDLNPGYGLMFWLNPNGELHSTAPATAFAARGGGRASGSNFVYVDPDNDLVFVVRWLVNGAFEAFADLVYSSLDLRR